MIKSEYDNIDELVQDDIDDLDDYESAKEGYDLMLKAMNLTDIQRTMLKGSFAYLEDMLRKEILAEVANNDKKARFARIGSYIFQYDDRVYGDTRSIKGNEVIEWIRRNHLEDISVYCDSECLFARMIDTENDRHVRESEVRTCIKEIRRYATIEELDEAVLNRLISRILIGEVKKVDGQKVQEVRIVYNFVGEIPEIAA